MKMSKVEFVEMFNRLKTVSDVETEVYAATGGGIDLSATLCLGSLTHYCVRLMCEDNDNYIEGIYDLLVDEAVSFTDGSIITTPSDFYDKMYEEE